MPLGFPDWHWPVSTSRFYGGSDILIETEASEDGYRWIWIGAHSQEVLRETAQLFPLDWEVLDLD